MFGLGAGFVCGCDDGILYIFERDEKKIYKQSKSFQIDNNYVHIRNIAISPSEVRPALRLLSLLPSFC
jgi:hypothetical protein